MERKMITATAGMVAELVPININISLRYCHPRRARSAGSVRIGRNTACRLDKIKILCMPSKYTLRWLT